MSFCVTSIIIPDISICIFSRLLSDLDFKIGYHYSVLALVYNSFHIVIYVREVLVQKREIDSYSFTLADVYLFEFSQPLDKGGYRAVQSTHK